MRRGIAVVALAVVTCTSALVVAGGGIASADTSATITLSCVAHAPIIGDQSETEAISVSTAAPAAVQPGATFSLTTTFPVDNIAASQSGGTVSSVKNLSYKLPVPANSTFVAATLSGGFNYGGSASATLQGSASTGYVQYSVPGPIPAGQDFQVPALTLQLTATTTVGATISPKLGGTSLTDPGFTTTAVVTSPISANVETDCYPTDPNPVWSTTTVVADDHSPPVITISTPADGGQYPQGQSIAASYSCDDGQFGSGVASCEGTVANGAPIDTGALGAHTFTVNAVDQKGNSSSTTHTYDVVPPGNDTTPPSITITTPPDGAAYAQGTVVNAAYSCTDNESGLQSCTGDVANGAAIDTGTVGPHTFTVSALDNEGNPHRVLHAYRVVPLATQQNWVSGDVTNRMPVACDTLFSAFHESIPTSSNLAPVSAAGGTQFAWSMAIADDVIPSFNNATNLLYRWKKPANGHFVSAAFTGAGNKVNGTAITINPDGTLQLTIASVTDQSILGIGDDHFNPPPFRAVIQVDGAPGTVVQNMFDYFQLTTTLGGTSHCPAGDPTFSNRVNAVLTSTTVVDATPPTITVTSPVQGAVYAPGATVPFSYSCADNAGTPSCNGDLPSGTPIDTSTSGPHQLSVTSVDAAGNTAHTWVTYSVANPAASVGDATVVEGAGPLTFTISLSNPSQKPVVVNYTTVDGSAHQPGDYTATSGAATFAPGTLTQTVDVPVIDDHAWSGDRTLSMSLVSAVNATASAVDGTGTIVEDDPPPVAVADASAHEGPGAALDFAVSLGADPNFPVTVSYETSDGSAHAPGRYAAASGTLSFSPGGPLTQHVVVPVVDDAVYNEGASADPTQTMTLTASTANGVSADGLGTIVDDETRPAVLNIGSATIREGDTFTRTVKLGVTLNEIATQTVTVHYATAPGSAHVGTDFTAKSGTLTFKPGQIYKPVSIPVKGDLLNEGDESFTVQLSSPANAVIDHATGTVVIRDDDNPSASGTEASISDVSGSEGSGLKKKTTLSFIVSLNQRPSSTVTLKYHTVSGTANTLDYVAKSGTLTFTTKQVAKVVTIQVNADTAQEPDETFTVVIDTPSGPVTITGASGTGTIVNDD